MATEITQAQKTAVANQPKGIASFLGQDAIKKNIASVIGENNVTTFISSIVSAVQTTPSLAECTHSSILNSALLGEALKLSPSPQLGNYYMVAYKNKGVSEATFQIGFKGLIQLAIRSGQYRKISASEIKEGELKGYNPITEEYVLEPIMNPADRIKAKTVGYYAMFELTNGYRKELFWTKEQMENHAKTYSAGYRSDLKYGNSNTFWSKNFDSMAKKTMLRQLISKWGIMSIDMQKAYMSDQAVIRDNGELDYVDNRQNPEEKMQQNVSENANSVEFEDATFTEVPNE